MANGNATIIVGSARLGSARLGSARLGRSIVPFFQRVKSYFIQFITNRLPKQGVLCLGFGFLRLPEEENSG